ncbi:MAG: hypothetical protein ABTQ34_03105 [Bdellovibrionales bacterium]
MNRNILFKTTVLTLSLCIGACAGSNIPAAKSTTGRNPQVAEVPSQDETVRGESEPAVVTLDIGDALSERRLSNSDDLPSKIIIPTTNLNAVPITAALQAVLAGTDIALSWDTGTLGNRLVTVVNLSGPLPRVVDRICAAAKVFCSYRNGSLDLHEKETFVVSLPPLAKTLSASAAGTSTSSSSSSSSSSSGSSANSMVDAIDQLIGGKSQVDEQGGNIIYTADVESQSRVSRYLEQLRNGRPLVVLQLYIWEVTLNKENAAGINWSQFKPKDIGLGLTKLALSGASSFASISGTSGSMSVGAVTTGNIDTSSVISFLSTQGRVQTISSPQVTFVSGSSAELKVGGKQRYISQVGQLVTSNNTSGTSGATAGNASNNTVSTDSIDTGLSVAVSGAYESGIVFANLGINLTNLVSLNPTSSGGSTIDLPETTDQKISTVIRVRPGDNLVMAGLVSSRDTNDREGVPIGMNSRIPTYGSDKLENHELVIIVKPSVILFSDANARKARKAAEHTSLPTPMLIDQEGARSIALPQLPAPQRQNPQPVVEDIPPLPRGTRLLARPTPNQSTTAVLKGDDGAPVGTNMMQRGLANAFDSVAQTMQPATTHAPLSRGAMP